MMKAIRRQPKLGLRRLSSTIASMISADGPFGPGFLCDRGVKLLLEEKVFGDDALCPAGSAHLCQRSEQMDEEEAETLHKSGE